MFNNSNDNKVRRRNVSSNNSGSSNRVRRPDNSYDEERLRENTKSKPLFEKTANNDFKRGNEGKSALSRKNGERLQPRSRREQVNTVQVDDYLLQQLLERHLLTSYAPRQGLGDFLA